jgi:cell division protein FtsN
MMKTMMTLAALAVAIPLALSVTNAQAQEADDLPRLGETAAEYNARISGRPVTKWQYERREQTTVTVGPTKDAKARAERRRQSACDRLSQRAAHNWSRSANEMYNDYCLD